ncbi:MAG TPA: signal peptidase I [Dehalococcoidia bacterium]|nr:signal peptidase I [Dehalococcoidia bacterium]
MKFLRDIIIIIVIAVAIFALLQATVGSYKVYGLCMLPNIHHGEYIIVNKASYFFRSPQRGEVIVLHSPRDSNSALIKRIIALPGDTVEINSNTVFVNGTPLVEPYILEPPDYVFPSQKIPTDHYFVLGDNRNNSADSHTGWTVPLEDIVGKAWLTYWPPPKWRTIKHYTLNVAEQMAELAKPSLAMKMPCPNK